MSKAHPQHTGPSAMTSPAQLERLGEQGAGLKLAALERSRLGRPNQGQEQ